MHLRVCLLVFSLCLAVGGCASAEGAYRDGMASEAAGDYDAAVAQYAAALRRDGDLPNARGRLAVAAREAVAAHLARARASGPIEAAEAWLAAEAVAAEARTAGVEADRPATYAADLAEALDAAVYGLLALGAARTDGQDYAGALAVLEQARRYRPSADRQRELDLAARAAYTFWADDDMVAGRYRDAVAHADAALGLTPPGPDAEALAALRAAAIDAGTVVVALFPSVTDGPGALPPDVLRDLDDRLDAALADAAGPFVALADPADVRRSLRAFGIRPGRTFRPEDAARLAADVGADVAVVVDLGAPAEREDRPDRRRVRSTVRVGGDTTSYVRTTTRLRVAVPARVRLLDARSRQVLCTETARPEQTVEVREATYRGDWRDLALGRDERDLFDADPRRAARDAALLRLSDDLVAVLARHAAACANARVP